MLSAAVRISQPSLSHAIVQLEQELGVPLFEKNGRNVELTQFGEVFLKQVRQSLEILDGSVDYLHRIAAGNGVVRLGLLRALGVEYALKNNPAEKAVKLLVKRIDVSGDKKNNVFNIQSTLNTLLEIMEGVDTLDAPPTREPDLGHKKKSRLARLLRPLSKLFPYQFRML